MGKLSLPPLPQIPNINLDINFQPGRFPLFIMERSSRPAAPLSKDRNGTPVRAGDRVRCACGHPEACCQALPARHHYQGFVASFVETIVREGEVADEWIVSAKHWRIRPNWAERVEDDVYIDRVPWQRPLEHPSYMRFVDAATKVRDEMFPRAELVCDHTPSGLVAIVRYGELHGSVHDAGWGTDLFASQLKLVFEKWLRTLGEREAGCKRPVR